MSLILIVLIVLLLFGGGGYTSGLYGGQPFNAGGTGLVGVLILVLLAFLLLGHVR